MVRYVAGDIGGTNSRLQLIELPEDNDGEFNQELERVVAEETYPSQKYASLTFIIQKFLEAVRHTAAHNTDRRVRYSCSQRCVCGSIDVLHLTGNTFCRSARTICSLTHCSVHCAFHCTASRGPQFNKDAEPAIACCLAVAGPVRANKSIITNVNWVLDGEEMAQHLNMKRVQIINDVRLSQRHTYKGCTIPQHTTPTNQPATYPLPSTCSLAFVSRSSSVSATGFSPSSVRMSFPSTTCPLQPKPPKPASAQAQASARRT